MIIPLLALAGCAPSLDVTLELCPEMPSVVEVSWTRESDAETRVEYGDGHVAYGVPGEAGDPTRVLVAGAKPGERLELRAFEGLRRSAVESITTGALPLAPPDLEVDVFEPEADDGRWLLTTLVGTHENAVVLLDRDGVVTWHFPLPPGRMSIDAEPALDAHGLWVLTQGFDAADPGRLMRIRLDGTLAFSLTLPDAHHAIAQRRSGAVLVNERVVELDDGGQELYGQRVVEVDAEGSREVVADLWDLFPEARGQDDLAPLHGNGLYYDGETDSLLWSMLELSTVIEVDLESGEALWAIGELQGAMGWPEPGIEMLHAPSASPAGALMLFDNGASELGARVLAVSVDPQARQVGELWSVAREDAGSVGAMGDARVVGDDHILVSWGMRGELTELDADHRVIWQLRSPMGLATGNVRRLDVLAPSLSP